MTQLAAEVPIKTTLVDITKCIGCRACQVACKQWNDRKGEETELDFNLGFQNPATLSANTLTLITFHELPDEKAPGGLHYLFTMRRCLHCLSQHVPRPARRPPWIAGPMGPLSTMRTNVSAADTASGRALGEYPQRNGTRWPRKYRSARIVRTGPTSQFRWPATGRHSASSRASCTAKALSRRPASRLARLIVCVSGPGKKSFKRRTTAFPPTPTSMWTTFTEKKRRAARVCCTCPPCPLRSSDSPMLAPRRIRRARKWLCMRFPPQCWRSAPCWVAYMPS